MSAANPNPMEKSIHTMLVISNAGGGLAIAMSFTSFVIRMRSSKVDEDQCSIYLREETR
jgi:hypothetical protein